MNEPYSATFWLLVTDFVVFNHSQVTRMTPDLTPLSPKFHSTPKGGRLSIDRFNVALTQRVFSGAWLELMKRMPRVRYLDYYATAATHRE
ncbi:hypothetical protein TNCV_4481801 [Trichonephila clavipes]|nr:hypothetical protein TNCV_4481801 [Trichonephila clavipes]